MMIRFVSLISFAVLASSLVFGQDPPALPKPESREAVIIPVKTLSGDAFTRLANMLAVFNVPYKADEKLRTILVFGPKDVVEQMRAVVEKLDRPGSEAAIGRNVDMTLTFLLCSTNAPTSAQALPADLEPVARQLRAVTSYKDISVLDIVPLRVQEGKSTRQTAQIPGLVKDIPGQSALLTLGILPEAIIRKESERYVRFDRVSVTFTIPYRTGDPSVSTQYQVRNVGVDTAGDFKEGQKTVLGKVSGIDDQSALFIVVSLKVLD